MKCSDSVIYSFVDGSYEKGPKPDVKIEAVYIAWELNVSHSSNCQILNGNTHTCQRSDTSSAY